MRKIKRSGWNTTFDTELRRQVNITAAELDTTANIVLEASYIYLKNNCNQEELKRILENRK